MGAYEKRLVEEFKKKTELNKGEEQVYALVHHYDHKPRRFYVSAPYRVDTFRMICSYIEFLSEEYDSSYSLDQTDIIEVLEKFYGCKGIKRKKANATIDMYFNRESFCGSGLHELQLPQRDEMKALLKQIVDNYRIKELA